MPAYKTKFQDIWLQDDKYIKWLQKVDNDPYSGRCKVCAKVISISGQGVKALDTHASGKKHQMNLPVDVQSAILFRTASATTSTSGTTTATTTTTATSVATKSQTSIIHLTNDNLAREAEIIFATDVVLSKQSFNSCANKSDMFAAMFPDSKIAGKFSCGATKCTYLVTFGLAPYFKELLCRTISTEKNLVVQFDESHNKVLKKGQMDLHVRYWDHDNNNVKTRYYRTEFMLKAEAKNVMDSFLKCIDGLEEEKILQVAMDGPNVNKSFYGLLQDRRKEENLNGLVFLGTCGLHIMHNSFKHGERASKWMMKKLCSSLYKIFHESPSRRSDYERITLAEDSDYALQFCGHRWVENEPVAKRGRAIWPKIREIVEYWLTKPKSKQPGQGKAGANTSYEHLCRVRNDPLIPVKLQFFEDVAKLLNSFLVVFQTDKPMGPFLAEELEKIIRQLCAKFIRKEVLKNASTTSRLLKVDVTAVENQVSADTVDLGYGIKYELQQLKSKKKVTDAQILNIKRDAKQFLSALCAHQLECSPLNFVVTRCLVALSPVYMAESSEEARVYFNKLLMKLVSRKKVTADMADKAKLQYTDFLEKVVKENRDSFLAFNKVTDRLDTFLFQYVLVSKYTDLAEVFRMVLILAHGQAQVERGFTVNKQLLDYNMLGATLIGQRMVHDHMITEDLKAHQMQMTPALMGHVKEARKRYFADQAKRSSDKLKSDREAKLESINTDIAAFNQKINLLENTVKQLKDDSEKFTFEAEKQDSLVNMKSVLSKSCALKRAATEKQQELDDVLAKKKKLIQKKNDVK